MIPDIFTMVKGRSGYLQVNDKIVGEIEIGGNNVKCKYTVTAEAANGQPAEVEISGLAADSPGGTLAIPDEITFDGTQFVVTSIGENSFMGCQLSGELIIPDSVKIIKASAFHNNGFSTIDFGEGVTSIGNFAFFNSQVVKLTIPTQLTDLGDSAISSLFMLESVDVEAGNTRYYVHDGVMYTTSDKNMYMCPMRKSGIIKLPDDIQGIPNTAGIAQCHYLTGFEITEQNQKYSDKDGILFSKDGKTLVLSTLGRV